MPLNPHPALCSAAPRRRAWPRLARADGEIGPIGSSSSSSSASSARAPARRRRVLLTVIAVAEEVVHFEEPAGPFTPWAGVATMADQFSPHGVADLPAVTPHGVANYFGSDGRLYRSPVN